MNSNYKRVPTRFEPDTRFELTPTAPGPFRRTQETELARLKNKLVLARLGDFGPVYNSRVRRAANEAEAVAWVTAYPLLVFPTLFEERAEALLLIARRQENVRERSRELLAV